VLEQTVDNPDQRMTSDVRQGKDCICGNFLSFWLQLVNIKLRNEYRYLTCCLRAIVDTAPCSGEGNIFREEHTCISLTVEKSRKFATFFVEEFLVIRYRLRIFSFEHLFHWFSTF
jgi:hypothetical protein